MRVALSRLYTSVLWVCICEIFSRSRSGTEWARCRWSRDSGIPIPSGPPPAPFPLADRGFFRLNRNGLRTGIIVDPFELSVGVIDIVLPLVAPPEYGFPLASVTDILPLPPTPAPLPPPENIKSTRYNTFYNILDYVLTIGSLNHSIGT